MSDSPHDCRPRSPLRSSVDFPGLGGCCNHTDGLRCGNCTFIDLIIITIMIPFSVCVMLWFHLVGQLLTRYHLSHHVHPHPHIMESFCSEKPFQGLDVVPWVSIIDVSLRYIYRLEPKHYAYISKTLNGTATAASDNPGKEFCLLSATFFRLNRIL